jgi:hypothetical protein
MSSYMVVGEDQYIVSDFDEFAELWGNICDEFFLDDDKVIQRAWIGMYCDNIPTEYPCSVYGKEVISHGEVKYECEWKKLE